MTTPEVPTAYVPCPAIVTDIAVQLGGVSVSAQNFSVVEFRVNPVPGLSFVSTLML